VDGQIITAAQTNAEIQAIADVWTNVQALAGVASNQTPWTSNIDGGGFGLSNTGPIASNVSVSAPVLSTGTAGHTLSNTSTNIMRLQANTVNANSNLYVVPNGTGTNTHLYCLNSSDTLNTARLQIGLGGAIAGLLLSNIGTPATPATTLNIGEFGANALTVIGFQFNGVVQASISNAGVVSANGGFSAPNATDPANFAALQLSVNGATASLATAVTGTPLTPITSLVIGGGVGTALANIVFQFNGVTALSFTSGGNITATTLSIGTPAFSATFRSFLFGDGTTVLTPNLTNANGGLRITPSGTGTNPVLYAHNGSDANNSALLQVGIQNVNTARLLVQAVGTPATYITSLNIGGGGADNNVFTAINFQFHGVTTATLSNDGSLAMPSMPTVAPPAGSKKLWADPADNYRVKYVA
jgi:hypothetical protein